MLYDIHQLASLYSLCISDCIWHICLNLQVFLFYIANVYSPFINSFQGICSAYDIILVCAVDFRQMVSLKITERPDSSPIKNEYEIPQVNGYCFLKLAQKKYKKKTNK